MLLYVIMRIYILYIEEEHCKGRREITFHFYKIYDLFRHLDTNDIRHSTRSCYIRQ